MSKYWDINQILPYQRHFNLINGERSIGKTYTTQKFLLKRAITKGEEFIYLLRTKSEKGTGAFEQAFSKVCSREFPELKFKWTIDECTDEDGEPIGYCFAMSEYQDIKKRSFPNVKWLLFDEYMIEENTGLRYFNGWREPNIFLNIYHSIDREEDRLICFMLGNNTSFYNPYHLHPAFAIPNINKGEIWTNENVLFQWAMSTKELNESRKQNKFLNMIEGTEYSQFAVHGEYKDDRASFVQERPQDARHMFVIIYNSEKYGVWFSQSEALMYISPKYDPGAPSQFAFTVADHKPGTMLATKSDSFAMKTLKDMFKKGYIRYENMETKKKVEGAILCIL